MFSLSLLPFRFISILLCILLWLGLARGGWVLRKYSQVQQFTPAQLEFNFFYACKPTLILLITRYIICIKYRQARELLAFLPPSSFSQVYVLFILLNSCIYLVLSCLLNDYTYKSACLTVTCSIFWFYGTCISSEKKPNCHYFLICFHLPFHHFSNTFLLGFLSQRCTHSSYFITIYHYHWTIWIFLLLLLSSPKKYFTWVVKI